MKRKLQIITSASAASFLAFAALAQESTEFKSKTETTKISRDRDSRESSADRLGRTEKASDLINREVRNYQNEKLGKVDNLAIDLESGRIVQVVLAIGGLLSVGDHLIAVPPGALHNDALNKVVHLDADKEKLKAAPKFELSQWETAQSRQVATVYQYYGQEPYFDTTTEGVDVKVQTDGSTGRARVRSSNSSRDRNVAETDVKTRRHTLGQVQKATKIIGTPVRNLQEEKLGKVENLVVDLAAGRVLGVVVSSGGFMGIGDELSAIPPTAFRFNPNHDTLQLDVSKETLTSAPHFKSGQWPDFGRPEYSAGMYRAYRVEPYFSAEVTTDRDPNARNVRERITSDRINSTDADNTARNSRDRDDRTLTPLDQGKSQADRDITARVRKDIMASKGLSTNARNVKIITINGRVTLRGPVNTDEEKRILADIAARATSNDTVDDQLEVKANGSNQP